MNPLAFGVALWVSLGLEWGLRDALELGSTGIAPRFAVVLLVFVCLWSSVRAGVIASLAVGVCLDLLYTVPAGGQSVVVLGPHALGCLLAGAFALNVRAVIFRRNVLAVAVVVLVAAALVEIVATAALTVRAMYDPIGTAGPLERLLVGLGSAGYTAVVGIAYAWVLGLFRGVFGFPFDTKQGFRIQSGGR